MAFIYYLTVFKFKLGFILIVESGDLENKALLCALSIKRIYNKECRVVIIKPRSGQPISKNILDQFNKIGVEFFDADLNIDWKDHPMMNKPYATCYGEKILESECEYIIYLDADSILLKPIDFSIFSNMQKIGIRPVDVRNIGNLYGEDLIEIWNYVFKVMNIDKSNLWNIKTTITNEKIYPYFNSGFIVEKQGTKLFYLWAEKSSSLSKDENFRNILKGNKLADWALDQIILASVLIASYGKNRIKILPYNYNFPFNFYFFGRLFTKNKIFRVKIDDIIHLHYHHRFYSQFSIICFTKTKYYRFLKNYIPLPINYIGKIKNSSTYLFIHILIELYFPKT